jgi:hypothetical protein
MVKLNYKIIVVLYYNQSQNKKNEIKSIYLINQLIYNILYKCQNQILII